MAVARYNLTTKTKVGSRFNTKTISFYADDATADLKAKAIHTALIAIVPSWVMPVLTKVVVEPTKGAIPSSGQYDAKAMYCSFSDVNSKRWKISIPRVDKDLTSAERDAFQAVFVTQGIKFLLKGESAPDDLHTITDAIVPGMGSLVDEFAGDTDATYDTP